MTKYKRASWRDRFLLDNCDGIKVNKLIEARGICRYKNNFSPYSSDNYHAMSGAGKFIKISVQGKIHKANSLRCLELNMYCSKTKGY